MSDEQTRLLTEIRDIAREHMELYRARSATAISTQSRAFRIWLLSIIVVAVSVVVIIVGLLGLLRGSVRNPNQPRAAAAADVDH
jgi:CHASE3 domain sensor protein